MLHLTIDLVVLLFSILIGFYTTARKSEMYLRLFPYFLTITLTVELIGQYYQKRGINNVLVFNLYAPIHFLFLTYFFSQVIPNKKIQILIGRYGILLPLLCLSNVLFIQGPHVFNTYTFLLGSLEMILLGITYFYQLFNSVTSVNLLKEPPFWISIGIIFFSTCSVTLIGSANYIALLPKLILSNMNQILLLVDAFFYLMFIIAFLCQIRTRSSSRLP